MSSLEKKGKQFKMPLLCWQVLKVEHDFKLNLLINILNFVCGWSYLCHQLALNLVLLESLFTSLSNKVLFARIMHLVDEQHNWEVGGVSRKIKNNLGFSLVGTDSVVLCY